MHILVLPPCAQSKHFLRIVSEVELLDKGASTFKFLENITNYSLKKLYQFALHQ